MQWQNQDFNSGGARLEVNIKKKKIYVNKKKKSITTISVIQKLIKRKL